MSDLAGRFGERQVMTQPAAGLRASETPGRPAASDSEAEVQAAMTNFDDPGNPPRGDP
jgi:hypothetical protein